jgi:hypothetical protein
MPYIISVSAPKPKSAASLGWYKLTIRRLELRGKVLHLTDAVTGGKVVISKGYHSVFLYFYLKPGDNIQVQGSVNKNHSVHGSGEMYFDKPEPSEVELAEREAKAEDMATDRWYELAE